VAVLFAALIMIAFGVYFLVGTDTLQHDYVFAGGGALVLLGGLGTLGAVVMLMMQVREWGASGIDSDVLEANVIESPPPNRGGAAARAAAAQAESESESSEE